MGDAGLQVVSRAGGCIGQFGLVAFDETRGQGACDRRGG
jgi:hypothetical protein